MSKLTETVHASEYLVSEASGERSREAITIGESGKVNAATVLGYVADDATAAAADGNTGDGALTMDATTPSLAGARPGVYTVRCTAASDDGGAFEVRDPSGAVIGSVDVGDTFASQVKFVIADGATDFAVGDGFDITVPSTGKYYALSISAVDGKNVAVAVLYRDVDATDGDVGGVANVRDCEVNSHIIIWPSGITDAQKAAATAQLASRGIIAR